MTEVYDPPMTNWKYAAYGLQGVAVDSQGIALGAFASGHIGAFDRRKCNITRGPSTTGLRMIFACSAVALVWSLSSTAKEPDAYQAYCASCHGRQLEGAFAPALLGKAFRDKWAAASSLELAIYIQTTMPVGAPNSLPPEVYADIHRRIAQANSLPVLKDDQALKATGRGALPPAAHPGSGSTIWANYDAAYEAEMSRRKGLLDRLTPVSDQLLQYPMDEDWLMWRRTPDTTGYSPLKQINRSNVQQLMLAWALSLAAGSAPIAPLIHDGVMFLNASGNVMALDASTGDLLWEYSGSTGESSYLGLTQPRTIALYGKRVYVPTLKGHLLALDMYSGKLLWDREVFASGKNLKLSTGPLVVRGKVIQGVSGCSSDDYPGGCFIVALDAATGKEIWRFDTIARPGQPGGDSWNGAQVNQRFGGSVWTVGSYDPELNLTYFGTGQTYKITTLLQPNAQRGESADALYTNTTLALNPDTGELVWHYQHLAGDIWDLDFSFERSLLTLPTSGGPRKVVVTGGKIGIFDVLDAKNGKYLSSGELGFQNLVASIDARTGHKNINPAARFNVGSSASVCPYHGSGRSWPSTAYDPGLKYLFVPLVDSCMEIGLAQDSPAGHMHSKQTVSPDSNGQFGRLAALNLRTQRIVWTKRWRARKPAPCWLRRAESCLADLKIAAFERSIARPARCSGNRS